MRPKHQSYETYMDEAIREVMGEKLNKLTGKKK